MIHAHAGDAGAVSTRALSILLAIAVLVSLCTAYRVFWRGGGGKLVIYCAHDSIHSEAVIRKFETATGIPVSIRFDAEATKSLGLVELLMRERSNPRCDVFWNNQVLGTEFLKEEDLLLPYKGSGYQRIPETFKDPGGRWAGFAARLRVYIINTDQVAAEENAVLQALEGDLTRVAVARPLYGTTLTHYAALWDQWGKDRLVAWHEDWHRRGVREVPGNAAVKALVAEGICSVGLTDTDDFFAALDAGKPVAMVPVRMESGAVICIPNSVAIIKGTCRLESAKKLVDFLLSASTEVMLATSRSRQIPLGPTKTHRLPAEVKAMQKLVRLSLPLRPLARARSECLSWLKSKAIR